MTDNKNISWYMKYRPKSFDELVFPVDKTYLRPKLREFWKEGFVKGNILAYGKPGLGKTSCIEVLIHQIIKSREDIFILDGKPGCIDNLKRWLQYDVGSSSQKVVKMEEMDNLNKQVQTLLKDGLMEKYQHNCTFLATTNHPKKIDPAILERFNIKIEFNELDNDEICRKLKYILSEEKVSYSENDLKRFIEQYSDKSLRETINMIENITVNGVFNPFDTKRDCCELG